MMKTVSLGLLFIMVAGAMLAGCEARVNRQRNNFGYLEIHTAARTGDVEQVASLIEQGAKVNAMDLDNLTALHTAAKNNYLPLAKLLLENHADVTMLTKDGWDPVHLAAWRGHNEMVELLMGFGAIANRKTDRGWTAVHMAAFKGYLPIINTVMKNWDSHSVGGVPELNEPDKEGNTPLMLALSQGHTDLVSFFVSEGVDVNTTGQDGNSLLHQAVLGGDQHLVSLLLSRGANPNARNKEGKTPYGLCVDLQDAASAELIVNAGGGV